MKVVYFSTRGRREEHWRCLMMVCLESDKSPKFDLPKLAIESVISLPWPFRLAMAMKIPPNYHYVVEDSLTGRH